MCQNCKEPEDCSSSAKRSGDHTIQHAHNSDSYKKLNEQLTLTEKHMKNVLTAAKDCSSNQPSSWINSDTSLIDTAIKSDHQHIRTQLFAGTLIVAITAAALWLILQIPANCDV